MRRSPFMNVPSFSNDEHAGRKIVACARAVSLRKRSCTTSVSRLREGCVGVGQVRLGLQDVPAHDPQPAHAFRRGRRRASASRRGRRCVGSSLPRRLRTAAASVSGAYPVRWWGSHPMCAEPCTLFCPRSGLTPLPGRPTLPVSSARFAMHVTPSVPWVCSVMPSPWNAIDGRLVAYRRAAARRSAASTPQRSATQLRCVAGEMPSELVEAVDALPREGLVDQPFLDDRRAHRVEDEHVRAGPRPQMHRRRTRRARCVEGR